MAWEWRPDSWDDANAASAPPPDPYEEQVAALMAEEPLNTEQLDTAWQTEPSTADQVRALNADQPLTDAQLAAAGQPEISQTDAVRQIAGPQPLTPEQQAVAQQPEPAPPPQAAPPYAQTGGADWAALTGVTGPGADARAEGLPEPTEAPLPTVDERIGFLQAMSPDERAAYEAQAAFAEEQAMVKERGRIARENAAQAAANAKTYQEALVASQEQSQKILEAAQELGQQTIDRDRWWNDRSVGQTTAAYIGAALSGWLNPGGPNGTIDLAMKNIDRDIRVQEANLDHQRASLGMQRGIVADMYAKTGDIYAAKEAARIAALHGMEAQMEEFRMQLDPAGTQARRAVANIEASRAMRQKLQLDMEERLFKRQLEIGKLETDRAAIRQRDIESRRQTGLGYANLRDKQRQREFDAAMAARKEETERREKERDIVATRGVAGVQMADGTPFVVRDPKTAADLEEIMAAGDDINGSIDRIEAIYADEGWQSDTAGGDEWQKATADTAGVVLNMAQRMYQLGAISKDDLAQTQKTWGGLSTTGVRDPTAGLEALRKNFTDRVNNSLRHKTNIDGRVYDGPRWEPRPDPTVEAEKADRALAERRKAYTAETGFESPAKEAEEYNALVSRMREIDPEAPVPTLAEFHDQQVELWKQAQEPEPGILNDIRIDARERKDDLFGDEGLFAEGD